MTHRHADHPAGEGRRLGLSGRGLVGELDKRRTKAEAGKAGRDKQLGQASSDASLSHGKSAAETAAVIGVSTSKIERARAVLDKAAPEVKAAVASGDMTINKAYQETRQPKAAGQVKTPDQEEAFYEESGIAEKGAGGVIQK